MAAICVYCGCNFGADKAFLDAARDVGRVLAEEGHSLVYGGGNVGLMGAVADATLDAGGRVVGVIPDALIAEEVAHTNLSEMHVVSSMHERKSLMASLSDGFLALPGGIGTLEEIMEAFVWTQLGLHPKPCALLNTNGFYDSLFAFLSGMVTARFLHEEQLSQLIICEGPREAINMLVSSKPKLISKWLDKG